MQVEGALADISKRGFVVVRGLLDAGEIGELGNRFERSRGASVSKAYSAPGVQMTAVPQLKAKLEALVVDVRRETDLRVDTVMNQATFFAAEAAPQAWHTDHLIYYLLQNQYHHLNFWMPIRKPDPRRSGLTFVPTDVLAREAPELHAATRARGAAEWKPGLLRYEDKGAQQALPTNVDLDAIAVTPEVGPGDAILIRGDVLHRTQDQETPRLAVSSRAIHLDQELSFDELTSMSDTKYRRLLEEKRPGIGLLGTFLLARGRKVTIRDLFANAARFQAGGTRERAAFVAAAIGYRAALLYYHDRSARSGTWRTTG